MELKAVLMIMVTLLLSCVLTLAFDVQEIRTGSSESAVTEWNRMRARGEYNMRDAGTVAKYFGRITEPAKYLVDGDVATTISLTHSLGRKLLYANGRYWLFYSDGPDVVFRTSVDGQSWGSKAILKEEAQGWCVYLWHEFREGINYLHYGFSPEWFGEGVYYRRGVMNADGTIAWSADEQLAVVGIPGVVGGFWGVVPDSEGYPFILYGWYTTTHPWETIHVYVTKSDYNNGTWVTSSDFPKAVYNATVNFRISAQIVPLTDQKMYMVYCPMRYYGTSDLPVQGRLWNGSALLGAEDISSGYQTSNLAFSIISQNDDVYLVYERELTSRELIFRRRHGGVWEPEEIVAPLVNYESFFTCSISPGGRFHVFWLEENVMHVVRAPDGSWSDIDYPFGESFNFLSGDGKDNVACIPYVNSGTIVVAWLERNGSPYTLYSGVLVRTLEGDVNDDGVVDASDLSYLSKAYGSKPGDENWNPDCDLNWDHIVDASDLFTMIENYGKTI